MRLHDIVLTTILGVQSQQWLYVYPTVYSSGLSYQEWRTTKGIGHSFWCPGALLHWKRDGMALTHNARQAEHQGNDCIHMGMAREIRDELEMMMMKKSLQMEIWNPLLSITWFNAHFELQYKPVSVFSSSSLWYEGDQEDGDHSSYSWGAIKMTILSISRRSKEAINYKKMNKLKILLI